MSKIKLFTIPYAGGNSNIFRPWKKQLNENIELCPVELAGRGTRLFEPLNNSISDNVKDLQIVFQNNKNEYAIFGHSMGAIIAFELLSSLHDNNIKLPIHVFFSGRNAPHRRNTDKKLFHLMNDEQFKTEVLNMGGTPEEIFNDPELANLFLPVLKNDFMICENYSPGEFYKKYDIDFSVLAGKEENYDHEELTAYEQYTYGETNLCYFNGGHFFIKESEKDVIDYINSTLLNYL